MGDPIDATDGDGDTLTYSIVGENLGEFTIVETSGQLRAGDFDYNYEVETSYTVDVKVDDGNIRGDEIIQTVTVSISNLDEPPDAPDKPTITSQTRDSLAFSWNEPETTGPPITSYTYQYRKMPSDPGTMGTAHSTSETLKNLVEDSSYQFRVRATNDEGAGPYSDPAQSRTNENLPPSIDNGALIATRSIDENATAGTDLGEPLTVIDPDIADGGLITWEIVTPDMPFTIDAVDNEDDADLPHGQLKSASGIVFDYEEYAEAGSHPYTFTVQVSDGQGGSDNIDVTVTVNDVDEKPGPPGQPTRMASTLDSLTAEWTAPDRNTGPEISDYDLQYILDGLDISLDDNWADSPSDPDTNRYVLVDGLVRGTSYRFRVNAYNDELRSDWAVSGPFTIQSNSDPIFDRDSQTIEFPENTLGDSIIGRTNDVTDPDEDTITLSLAGSDAGSFRVDPTTGDIKTASDATFDYETDPHEYSVTVRADDGKGGHDTLDVTINLTDVDEPPGQPDPVTFSNVASDSFTMAWTMPANSGPEIENYEARYGPGEDGPWQPAEFPADVFKWDETGVTPNSTQYASVRAYNAEGWGEWSETASVKIVSNRPPIFVPSPLQVTLLENTPGNTPLDPPYTVTDPEDHSITLRLAGPDADLFEIDTTTDALITAPNATFDYETGPNAYAFTVVATDELGVSSDLGS